MFSDEKKISWINFLRLWMSEWINEELLYIYSIPRRDIKFIFLASISWDGLSYYYHFNEKINVWIFPCRIFLFMSLSINCELLLKWNWALEASFSMQFLSARVVLRNQLVAKTILLQKLFFLNDVGKCFLKFSVQ